MKRRHRPRSSSGSSGFTLVELMVVISATAALSLLGVRLLMALMHLETSTSLSAAREITLQQLEDRFRSDAHAADSAEWSPATAESPARLVFHQGAETARYEFLPEAVQYARSAGEKTIREHFSLTGLDTESQQEGDWVSLQFIAHGSGQALKSGAPSDGDTPAADGVQPLTRISARIGLHQRLTETAPPSGEEQP